jgi:hypothetical protein
MRPDSAPAEFFLGNMVHFTHIEYAEVLSRLLTDPRESLTLGFQPHQRKLI